LYFVLDIHSLILPAVPFKYDLGLVFIPVAMFIMVGASNAVNLTDGLDGLAGLLSATAFAAYGVIAMLQGPVFLLRFCFVMVGAQFAFLWFNAHPAEIVYGRLRLLLAGRGPGGGGADERPVGAAAVDHHHAGQRGHEASSCRWGTSSSPAGSPARAAGYFKIAPLHLHFRAAGLERDPGGAALSGWSDCSPRWSASDWRCCSTVDCV
jgi:hypothetical protein